MEEEPVTPVCAPTKRKADEETARGTVGKRGRKTTPARQKGTPQMTATDTNQQTESMMEKLFKDLGESLTKKMSDDLRITMDNVNEKIGMNTKNIEIIHDTIRRIERRNEEAEKRLESKIDQLSRSERGSTSSAMSTGDDSPFPSCSENDMQTRIDTDGRNEQYNLARRTLRLWPVDGVTEELIMTETLRFIRQKLKVDTADCRDVDVIRARRTRQPRRAPTQHEVAVVFLDKHVRDVVASHGKNLACFTDEKGASTAGVRLEYPGFLGRDFRDLDWYGREMRQRHGKGTRRNIKFNDDDNTLYLDICLPGDDFWHRIPHVEARDYRQRIQAERSRKSRISLEGPTREPTNANRTPLGAGGSGLMSQMRTPEPRSASERTSERSSQARNNSYVSPVRRH